MCFEESVRDYAIDGCIEKISKKEEEIEGNSGMRILRRSAKRREKHTNAFCRTGKRISNRNTLAPFVM